VKTKREIIDKRFHIRHKNEHLLIKNDKHNKGNFKNSKKITRSAATLWTVYAIVLSTELPGFFVALVNCMNSFENNGTIGCLQLEEKISERFNEFC
jgi:hypothetical protein